MPWMVPRLVKNLLAGPVTRRYPSEKRTPFADVRGALRRDPERCDVCGDCVRLCPALALVLEEKERSITYDPFRCVYCCLCVETCRHGGVRALTSHEPPARQPSSRPWS